MSNLNPVESYITIFDVFPDTKNDLASFIDLLKGLSKTDSIIWCSRLNIIMSSTTLSYNEKQQYGVKQFLSSEDINNLNRAIQNQGKKTATLFFRGQILELLRWIVLYCKDYANDGNTFENLETRRTFAKALLIASDIWEKRIFKNWYFNDEDIETKKKLVLGSVRKIIESQLSTPELEKTFGRGWTLFNEYLPQFYKSFYSDFQNTTGLSIEEYFICLVSLITNFIKDDSTNIFQIDRLGNDPQSFSLFRNYIKLESQNSYELRTSLWRRTITDLDYISSVPEYDYKPIREKPIFFTENGRGIIIDPIFYCERALIGPLFYVSKQCGNQVFSLFGKAFEKYSCDILQRMYPEPKNLCKRLFCNIELPTKRGVNIGEIDACLNDVYELVLFEMKAIFIRDNAYLDSPDKLLEIIKEKYGVTQTYNSKSIKGVGQLARIINEVVLNKMEVNGLDLCKVQKIYPVLVVHDSLLHSPLYGEFLASEFKELIAPDSILSNGEMIKTDTRILPLILMTIEELENIETASEHFGMKEFLNDYSIECPDRKVSINNFVANSKKYTFYHNKYLASKSLDIIQKTGKYMFNDTFNK